MHFFTKVGFSRGGRRYLSPVRWAFFIFVKNVKKFIFVIFVKNVHFVQNEIFRKFLAQNFMRRSLVFRSSYLLVIDEITFFAQGISTISRADKRSIENCPQSMIFGRKSPNRKSTGFRLESRKSIILIDFRESSTTTVRRSQVLIAKNRDFSRRKIDPRLFGPTGRDRTPFWPKASPAAHELLRRKEVQRAWFCIRGGHDPLTTPLSVQLPMLRQKH